MIRSTIKEWSSFRPLIASVIGQKDAMSKATSDDESEVDDESGIDDESRVGEDGESIVVRNFRSRPTQQHGLSQGICVVGPSHRSRRADMDGRPRNE